DFYINSAIRKGDTVIDATVGNGNDTLKLSNAVGESGIVYGFDIQQKAIDSAKRQNYKYNNVKFINESHADMDKFVTGYVSTVMFNLGYLPGGDHSICTRSETTISALEKAMALLSPGGTIITVIYRGGDSGFGESDSVVEYLKSIDYKQFNVLFFDYINRPKNPPMVCVIQKKCNAREQAIRLVESGKAACVVVHGNEIVSAESPRGIAYVIDLYEKGALKDAFVADKIIGKAAAMLFTLGGVKGCYGENVSKTAVEWLKTHNVDMTYKNISTYIVNRRGDGMCPMECTVADINDEHKAVQALKNKIAELKSGTN
ncbi:MAG: DUF1893 domain-containing protein, partial [Clostridia bacterium]|nr:DUF1893 domain-containing protein [Clostridia bacterium]